MQDSFDGSAGQAPGLKQQVRELIDYDDARNSAPQEHAATLLGAGAFALCALRAQSRLGAVLHAMLAGALLFRAASGRDGLRRWAGAAPARPETAQAQDWRSAASLASDPAAQGTGAP
nr:hypothetical protein [Variovorax boronicumulans]